MRELRTSGSVGGRGRRLPWPTRHERSATTPYLPASAALRSPSRLDILHEYACGGRASRALHLRASPASRDELHE
jgi:hypothetical protein